jgi:WD40 repeat protein
MLPNLACSLILTLYFSLDRRMIATLINFVAEKPDAHSDYISSVAFSPDGSKIVSGSGDQTIKVWDSGAPRALDRPPPWPQLTPAGLSGS